MFPNWLSLILVANLTAPALEIPEKLPVAEEMVWLRIILLFTFRVTGAAELTIPVNAPVPVFFPEITVLVFMLIVPETIPAPLLMPVNTDAAVVPKVAAFRMVLPVMEVVPVPDEVLLMPLKVQTPVVVAPFPTEILSAMPLPMMLLVMVKLPEPPVVTALKVYPSAAPPPVLMVLIELLSIVPAAEAVIKIPVMVGVPVPEADRVLIVLPFTFTVIAVVVKSIALTVAAAAEEEILVMVLVLTFIKGEVLKFINPATLLTEAVKLLMLLLERDKVLANPPPLPILIPLI